jgi:hypothetical protein
MGPTSSDHQRFTTTPANLSNGVDLERRRTATPLSGPENHHDDYYE